jgi:hypothetical protein
VLRLLLVPIAISSCGRFGNAASSSYTQLFTGTLLTSLLPICLRHVICNPPGWLHAMTLRCHHSCYVQQAGASC